MSAPPAIRWVPDGVADYLEKWGQEGEQYYADPTALAGLIRALIDRGALNG